MELEFLPFSLSFLGLLLLFFFLLMVWKTLSKTSKISGKLPPGPRKLPFIGNIHNLFGGLPHIVLRDLAKKYGPLMHLQLGEVSTVIVSSAEMAKEVLVTHDPVFANRPDRLAINIMWYDKQDMIFTPYGDHWRQLRKICIMELLSNKNVRSFSYIRKDEIMKLMKSIRSSQGVPVNVTEMFFRYATFMTCRAAFGTISKDTETMIKCLKEAMVLAAGFDAADVFPSLKILPLISGLKRKLLKMHDKMDEILDDVINQHKLNHKSGKMGNAVSGEEDLIDVLLRLQESGNLQMPITDRNIKGVLFDIFTAGTDTSSVTSEWAMSELMKHPRVMAKAQAEVRQVCKGKETIEEDDIQKLVYLKVVVKEALRLHPPGPLIPRASRENREVKGYMISNKSHVLVNAYAIARDPEYWDDPEMFKPERFDQKSVDYTGSDFQFLPFGTGRRMCPGVTFGVANIELPLAHLLFHFDWSLPNGMKPNDLDMDEAAGLSINRKNNLYLVATAYCHPMN
ncbi:premnaspirodiene oxygenase-like [Coffea eugenioides]|uniref:Premnaspirodiene oxygenase n=1 Tax=Coffea arabica TaxID=13443 RepID=A0A6P6TN26_COFAR|nr:premnaspirodiene oxygenase-like [Coffea arabica]XP_027182200.1 premnaspirodiene oxygenase-like [Coffea eugenioides]